MPASTIKTDLIEKCETDFAKLQKLIAPIPEDVAMAKDADGVSIKDILGHRAHWIDLFLGWQADGAAGRPVHLPAEGWKWNQLPAYNSMIRDRQAGLDWDAAKALLADRHRALMDFLAAQDQDALYGAPMVGHDKWPPGRFAESSGASHYRSAAKTIRARLKALG